MDIPLRDKLNTLSDQNKELLKAHQPSFIRLNTPQNKVAFLELLENPGLKITDCVLDQLKELMKIRHPEQKLSDERLATLAMEHLGNTPEEHYGVWVYYPWSNRLVHIVDEQEFIELRTSRNQYKITREERDLLAQKKIGVIGLSVGQSVSLTIAMERIAGELRLADFDSVELTNLNRIRTGIHNLGLPKVYVVAREIAELDPFIKVRCFNEGLSEKNMDDFFLTGGKLDLLVEESDGFDIKILSRYKAKALQVPVIMEANDRCMIDVERFDLEPDRPLLHGLLHHLDIDTLKALKTNEEKIPYMLDVLGLDTASNVLKASMLEIEQSITTWPQLASSTTMGGGVCADTIRRIFLGQYSGSGRFHIDLEELIREQPQDATVDDPYKKPSGLSLTEEEMKVLSHELSSNDQNDSYLHLSPSLLQELITAAALAPSGGNTQPWKWIYQGKHLFLFHDAERSYSLLDFHHLASYIALGAAIENLVLKAHELKLEINLKLFPKKTEQRLIAQFGFTQQLHEHAEPHLADELVSSIPLRSTNRMLSERKALPEPKLEFLKSLAYTMPGAQLHFFDTAEKMNGLADIIAQVERIRIMHPWGHKDFNNEIRWTEAENLSTRDGIDIATIDLTASEKAGFLVAKKWEVIELLKKWKKGKAFERMSRKSIASASCIGLLTMPAYTVENYINGGRALQRIWLGAHQAGIAFQPQSPATFFFARQLQGKGEALDNDTRLEIQQLNERFKKITGIPSHETEVFLFRLSLAEEPKVKSLRRPLDEVFKSY